MTHSDISAMNDNVAHDQYSAEAVFTSVGWVLPASFVQRNGTGNNPSPMEYQRLLWRMGMDL